MVGPVGTILLRDDAVVSCDVGVSVICLRQRTMSNVRAMLVCDVCFRLMQLSLRTLDYYSTFQHNPVVQDTLTIQPPAASKCMQTTETSSQFLATQSPVTVVYERPLQINGNEGKTVEGKLVFRRRSRQQGVGAWFLMTPIDDPNRF